MGWNEQFLNYKEGFETIKVQKHTTQPPVVNFGMLDQASNCDKVASMFGQGSDDVSLLGYR